MSNYYTQPRNEIAAPLRDWDRLKADGNLTYAELIALVKDLWAEAQPDIPIFPYQSKNFAQYPCLVYSLEVKVPQQHEPKKRIRETVEDSDSGQLYRIYGQVFKYVVTFSAVTETEPELAEGIIEAFELFIKEMTPIIKKLGAVEMFYGRRLPDSTENRTAEDTCKRSLAYEFHLEEITRVPVDKLRSILVQARLFLDSYRNVFTTDIGDNFITVQDTALSVEDQVIVKSDPSIFLPLGLNDGWRYEIAAIDGNKIYLKNLSGATVPTLGTFSEQGGGRLEIWLGRPTVAVEDQFFDPEVDLLP